MALLGVSDNWTCMCMSQSLNHVHLFATLWTVAHQAPLSMGISRGKYWSGLPFSPGDLPDPGIKPVSPMSPALQADFFYPLSTGEAPPL